MKLAPPLTSPESGRYSKPRKGGFINKLIDCMGNASRKDAINDRRSEGESKTQRKYRVDKIRLH